MIKPQTLKGFRDFLPHEARKRKYVLETLQNVFESFGFEPLETPTLEYEELLTGKYGEEGDKLMYRFEDNGKRRVAMRYDQTVPLARVVAQYQNEITYPFKRYNIQNVWRADKPQKGRFREFLQCDADIVGIDAPTTDAEILAVVSSSLQALGFRGFKILVNDRHVFGELPAQAIITIDKLKKIGEEGVKTELVARGFAEDTLEKIQNTPLPDSLETIINLAARMGVDLENIRFEPTLARGLDYYTGLIFEIEIDGYTVGSVCGGGRYDNLIGMFAGKQIPAVGFAFGFDRIMEAMAEQALFPAHVDATAEVLVTIFGPEHAETSLEIATKLRGHRIKTELWLEPKTKMEKQLKYANTKAIPYVIIAGPSEIANNVVVVKDMKKREQQEMTLEEFIKKLSSFRAK
jgi:histidyl-tRNA synthetase